MRIQIVFSLFCIIIYSLAEASSQYQPTSKSRIKRRFSNRKYYRDDLGLVGRRANETAPLSPAPIKCKYIILDKTYGKSPSTSSATFMNKLFQINTGRVDLNTNLNSVKIHIDDCLNKNSLEKLELSFGNNTIVYGVDISSNNIDDHKLDLIFTTNPIFKYNLNTIRFLNLTDNLFTSLSSFKSENDLDLDEFNYLNDINIKPDEFMYLISRFINLEVLLLDQNPLIKFNISNGMNIYSSMLKKLKILSMNKCNLNVELESSIQNDLVSTRRQFLNLDSNQNDTKLIYFGLSNNRLFNLSSIEIFLPQTQIDMLDLSFNKIINLEYLINRRLFSFRINKINLERNMISEFNVNELDLGRIGLNEINLKFNLLRNTSIGSFRRKSGGDVKLSVKLSGNQLSCDCNSLWLLEEVKKLKAMHHSHHRHHNKPAAASSNLYINRKRPKSSSKTSNMNESDSNIKLIFKRAIEEISLHHSLDDDDSDLFLQRQKRVKLNNSSETAANDSMVRIVDLEYITCIFLDVNNKNSSINEDEDTLVLDSELKKQNFQVDAVKYKEKLIINSVPEDYMCYYTDHCRPDECDCCGFLHCHCRFICPKRCRCYFDAKIEKNIIDCSEINLDDIEVNDSPIESVTDMRLNANSLKQIKSHAFFGFFQLKYLYLQNNQISSMTNDAFEDLKNSLKLLNLARNKLTHLNGDEFNNLNELQVLILNENPLKQIDHSLINFNSLPNLKVIYLKNTSLPYTKLKSFINYVQNKSNITVVTMDKPKPKPTTITTTTTTTTSTTTTTTKRTTTTTPSKMTTTATTTSTTTTSTTTESTTPIYSFTTTASRFSVLMDDLDVGYVSTEQNILESDSNKEITELNDENIPTNRTNSPENTFLFLSEKFFSLKWYYYPLGLFVSCLIISFFLVIVIILIARKCESKQINSRNSGGSSSCCCFGSKKTISSSASSSCYLPNKITNHEEYISYDEEEIDDDDDNESDLARRGLKKCCIGKSSRRSLIPCRGRSSSFDSYDFYQEGVNGQGLNYCADSASVPVSRSIENLNLNVLIYFNVSDGDYVNNYLMPCLRKCLTIIPDTKYILKPQNSKFVILSQESFLNLTNPNTESQSSNNSSALLPRKSNQKSNNLIANILVISDNFYGYKPMADSLVSLKMKTSSTLSANNTSSSSSGTAACYTNSIKPKSFKSNAESSFKNAFKINLSDVKQSEHLTNIREKPNFNANNITLINTSKSHSLNNKLLRRFYETARNNSSSTSHTSASSSASSTSSSSTATKNRNSVHISSHDSMYSSYAYNEKLQFKLEKYLEHVCLKSNTFSKTNFSYVDYTKR